MIGVAGGPLTGIPDVRPCTLGGLDPKSAIELLTSFTGSVRVTVDPQAAETLVEECGDCPPRSSRRRLALHPPQVLRRRPRQAAARAERRPLTRAFLLAHDGLPATAARILRFLALAPLGRADAHTASALAGCSVSAAATTLADFEALGLVSAGEDGQYEVRAHLVPLLRAQLEERDRPAEVQLARARMLERTVRLLQSCRAVTEPEGSPARRKLAGLPRALRFPNAAAGAAWLDSRRPVLLASARLAVADGELDTLARRLIASLVRALAAHRAPRPPPPSCTGCTGSSWTWPSAADCTASGRRPCSTWPTSTPAPAGRRRLCCDIGRLWRPDAQQMTRTRPVGQWNP